ncbi:MAG: hypothetical protein AAFO93_15625 [Pseudomonadota bacterium]
MSWRVVAISFAALVGVSALLGGALGLRHVNLSETEVINAYAARYIAETGGVATDCYAEPLDRGWLRVICAGAGGSRQFDVGRWGQQINAATPSERPEA